MMVREDGTLASTPRGRNQAAAPTESDDADVLPLGPNPAVSSPVLWGYGLARPPAKGNAKATRDGLVTDKPSDERACHICLIGSKPGCPFCWEFPEDIELQVRAEPIRTETRRYAETPM